METREKTVSLPALTQQCREQFWWPMCINLMTSVEQYKELLHLVWKDVKPNPARQQVLEVFTRDVCAEHLSVATDIWTMYTQNIEQQ